MRAPQHTTFTGLDERTDIGRVNALSEQYSLEWGVLFSPQRSGNEPRYPGRAFVERLFREKGPHVRLAAHVCGGYSKQLIRGLQIPIQLGAFDRVQVNYVPRPQDHPEAYVPAKGEGQLGVREILEYPYLGDTQPIIQWRTLTFPEDTRMQYLFDKSGGKGQTPPNWPKHPGGDRLVGYAGGLSHENIQRELTRMAVSGPYWIDMEGRVRTSEDWLNLDACQQVAQLVQEWAAEERR